MTDLLNLVQVINPEGILLGVNLNASKCASTSRASTRNNCASPPFTSQIVDDSGSVVANHHLSPLPSDDIDNKHSDVIETTYSKDIEKQTSFY